MPSNRAVFFYRLVVLLVMLPWILKHGISVLKTRYLHRHTLRALLSFTGTSFFMYGLKYIEVANATAVGCLEQVFVVLLGIMCFGENFNLRKMSLVLLSFIGAVIIVNPNLFTYLYYRLAGNDSIAYAIAQYSYNHYYWFIVAATIAWALNAGMVKVLSRTDNLTAQSFYNLSISAVFGYLLAFIDWVPSDGLLPYRPGHFVTWSEISINYKQLLIILMIGAFCLVHTFSYLAALSRGQLSTIGPFQYSRLAFSALLGFAYMQEVPGTSEIIGYIIIVSTGILLVRDIWRWSH